MVNVLPDEIIKKLIDEYNNIKFIGSFNFDESWFVDKSSKNLYNEDYSNFLKYNYLLYGRNIFKDINDSLHIDSIIEFFGIKVKKIDDNIIIKIISENQSVITEYQNGNLKAINQLIGKALKIDKSLNPQDIISKILKLIENTNVITAN